MKALVTRGSGFIGSNTVRLLLENNIEVRVINNLSSGYFVNILEYVSKRRIEFAGRDTRSYKSVAGSVGGVDVVFHLAASAGRQYSIGSPQLDSEANMIGTINVLETMRHAGTKRVVHSSSIAIFGELATPTADEEHPRNTDYQYGVSKFVAEKAILAHSGLYGFEGICLRYFNIYGVNRCFDLCGNVIPISTKRIFSGEPITILGDRSQTKGSLNTDDIAKINYITTTDDVRSDVFNTGGSNSTTINTLVKMVQRIPGINVNIHYAPKRIEDVKRCKVNADEIFNCLGYKVVVGLEEGLREYID